MQDNPVLEGLCHEIGIVMGGNIDQINFPAEKILHRSQQPKVPGGGIDNSATTECDQEIEVAADRIEITARCRTEELESLDFEAIAKRREC